MLIAIDVIERSASCYYATGPNNFMRPSTPSQFRSAVTDGHYTTQTTFNDAGTRSFVREAQNTFINRWSAGNATWTFDESTFHVGDKIHITRFYETTGIITVITDQGSIFLSDGTNASTQSLGEVGTIILEKVDTSNWIART
jgi:hypothetical protein